MVFSEHFLFVENILSTGCDEREPVGIRTHIGHTKRVLLWVDRLLLHNRLENPDIVRLAALFHDVGYARDAFNHAEHSATILKEYAAMHPIPTEMLERTLFLVSEHSNKALWMNKTHAPDDIILLMEADLLDEEGALGLVRDFLTVGAEGGGYEEAYAHMMQYEPSRIAENPMVTTVAKQYWETKQALLRQFLHQFSFDMGIGVETE